MKVEESCANCKFWNQFWQEERDLIGSCRRFPPQRAPESEALLAKALLASYGNVPPQAYSQHEWSQPITVDYQWCGEWRTAE